MNKTKYEFAEMEIVVVDNVDIVCTSFNGDLNNTNSDFGPGSEEDI